MTKKGLQLLLIAVVLLSIASCKRHERPDTSQTETMAPVAAQPSPTGTDAMTQTVDIEDSRSDAEGGGITETSTAQTATTTSAATTTTTTGKAVKKPPTKKNYGPLVAGSRRPEKRRTGSRRSLSPDRPRT